MEERLHSLKKGMLVMVKQLLASLLEERRKRHSRQGDFTVAINARRKEFFDARFSGKNMNKT